MPLILEIEHLSGVAFAAQSPASSTPDWPPQPDRIFSALVAAWGARGERPDERAALVWLEAQEPPMIAASSGAARTPVSVYVPPNDYEVSPNALSSRWFQFLKDGVVPPKEGGHRKLWRNNIGVLPAERSRVERTFPAFRPHDAVVRLIWPKEPDAASLAALNALAADTPYIGNSSSLTRCRFHTGEAPTATATARRRIYPTRLEELETAFKAGRRPSPGAAVRPAPSIEAEPAKSIFSDRWLVLEHVDGDMPDLRAAALVSRELRRVLMSGYKQGERDDEIPTVISGHAADGAPAAEPHLAIVPLAYIGSGYADGHVYGFALVPPEGSDLLADAHFQGAMRNVSRWKDEKGWRELELNCGGFKLSFTPSGESTRHSLDPRPYVARARTWATATPILLDRHLKAKGNAEREAEMITLVRHACVNIGLPEPERVATAKHSALHGAPAASPSGSMPRWTRWRLPESLASRQLTHAVIQFDVPVRGPVILGAGRFSGLGLARALDRGTRG